MKRGVNAVIFTDCVTNGVFWQRSSGAYRVATDLRAMGLTVQVIDFWSYITLEGPELACLLLDKFVGSETMFIGFSSTFFSSTHLNFYNRYTTTEKKRNQLYSSQNSLNTPEYVLLTVKEHARSINPKVDIIMGGARSGYPDPISTIKFVGYGEEYLKDYVRWKRGNHPFFAPKLENGVKILDYNAKGEGFDFASSTIRWVKEDCIQPNETLPIEISRGCIFRCKFCAFPLNGRSKLDYLKNVQTLEDELLYNYENFGTTRYIFADDTYNDTNEKLEQIAALAARLPFKLEFATFVRLDLIAAKPEQAELMKAGGLVAGHFGIETFNTEAGKTIGKGASGEKLLETLHWLREDVWKHDVLTSSSFVLGLPKDDYRTINGWLEPMADHRFPLHNVVAYPLMIINKERVKRTWYSEFELHPAKFGYTLTGTNGMWRNHIYKTNYPGISKIATEFFNYCYETGRFNFTSHVGISTKDYGYDERSMLKITKYGAIYSGLQTAVQARFLDYLTDVFNVETE